MNYIIKGGKYYTKGTLAHYLDNRRIAIEEPDATSLPATINPFKLIVQDLLKNNCAIIKIKHSEIKYSTQLLGLLNELIPAEQAILIYIDVDDLKEQIRLKEHSLIKVFPIITASTDVPLIMQSGATAAKLDEVCE